MAEHEVVYTFRAVDEISKPMEGARRSLEEAQRAQQAVNKGSDEVVANTARAQAAAQAMASDAERVTEASQGASASTAEARQVMAEADATGKTYKRTAEEVASASSKASAQVKALNQDQTTAVLKSVETLSAMHAVQSGLSAVTSSVQTLGIVDEQTAQTLKKVTAGVQLLVGTAQAVKGVVTLFQSLNSVLKTTAIVSTFASIAENPAKGALIVGGASLAAGAVAGYMYSATQNNHNTTINVQHESTARQAETLVDTGTWY